MPKVTKRKNQSPGIKEIQSSLEKLYNWYINNHRELPFRKNKDFYSIWVSEVMLQQTRIEAMLPIYHKFMNAFPNINSLAKANVEKVLMLWSGLGYYSRAKNLHEGAKQIVTQFNERFPDNLDEAMKIRGVGPYTAAAVLSMSYGKRFAVVDGNVKRVLSRFFLISDLQKREYQSYADELLNVILDSDPSIHNQALMECGSLICKPKKPSCKICPLQNNCQAFFNLTLSDIEAIPKKEKLYKSNITMKVYIIENGGKILINKSNDSMFFKRNWFFPYTILNLQNETFYESHVLSLFSKIANNKMIGNFKHHITRYNIIVELYKAEINFDSKKLLNKINNQQTEDGILFVAPNQLSKKIISSILKKAMNFI